MTNKIMATSSESIKEKQAWFAIWCFALLIALPLLIGVGKPLIFVFPLSAVSLGLFLYLRTPHLYIGFVWWIFFLVNLIRRLIDYHSGYITPGPWGFTSVLVAAISLITVVQYLPTAHQKGATPFVLTFSALAYAFLVGFSQNPLNALVNGTLGWLCPVAFGFHIFMQWRDYPRMRNIFIKTFFWGVLVMGIYGIIQYVFVPPWEQFWLNNIDAGSFGKPVPFEVRVSSSSGSPQSFAALMLVGLIVIFCEAANPLSYIASGFGYISFILTMARAVWLSAAISIPLFLLSLKPSYQIRMIIVAVIIFVTVATTLFSWDPVYEKFYARFETFLNPEQDVSLNSRVSGYQAFWSVAIDQFLGQGIGFSFKSIDSTTSLGVNDGSVFPLLFTFGWLGLTFYLGGFLLLLIKLLRIPDARSDIFIGACRMAVLCVLLQAGFNSVFDDSVGLIMWGFSAVGLAGHNYYSSQRRLAYKNI